MATEAQAATARAHQLLREAREHKRASRRHRDRARELKQQLDELIGACAKRGIHIQVNAQPEGGHGERQQQEQRRRRHA